MSTAPPSLAATWGPGLIGVTIGVALSGVGIGQIIFYVLAFPKDMMQLKALAFVVSILDNSQTIALIWLYHHLLIDCRSSGSPDCVIYMPAAMIFIAVVAYCVTFIVQSFYAHRVWIISGQNRVITFSVILSALAQMALGMLCTAELLRTPTYQALRASKFSPLAAVSSAVCDGMITASIMYYLRPARTGLKRKGNYMKKLNAVFVQMGLFCCINASVVAVSYYTQDGRQGVISAVPGIVLSKAYTNSILSVLNARKGIRDERQARNEASIELPTIRAISTS